MKKLILFLGFFLLLASSVSAQELTLDNSLAVNAQIIADTLADGSQAHSVYKVESNTYYYFDGTLDCDFDLVIEGPDNGWILHDPNPPIFFQTPASDGSPRDMINLNQGGSVVLKNILLTGLHPNDANISSFVRNFAGYKIVWDNCVFTDHQDHATRSTGATDEITITNCVFINMDRRRYSPFGGMPFRLDATCTQVTFENNTVVNGARLFGNGGAVVVRSKMTEIHNTVLNQQVNGHEIQWLEALQANNIYYNWSFRGRTLRTNGYEAPFTTFETFSGVSSRLDSISLYEGKNLFYLDPAFPDYWNNVMNPTKSDSDKVFQCYLWNVDVDSTIQADDNFTIGKNYWQFDPMFTVPPGNTDSCIAWSEANWAGENQPVNAPDWRVTPPVTWNPDGTPNLNWPPAWELSYSNSNLQMAGTDGLPLGDLNWYPSAKETYLANRDQYIAALRDSMTNATWVYNPGDSASAIISPITAIDDEGRVTPTKFSLRQNHPNPFNPTTTIEYSIGKAGLVTIELFNTLGQKVKTLVNGNKAIGEYKLTVDGSGLASGIYFYSIKAGNYRATKKMLLMK